MFVFITIVCSNGFRKRLCWLVKKKGIFMLVQWAHARRTTIIDNSTIQKSSMSKNGVSWIVYYHIKIRSSSVNKWNKSLKGKSCKLYGILEKRFLRVHIQEIASQNNDVNISSHTKHSYVFGCVSEYIK